MTTTTLIDGWTLRRSVEYSDLEHPEYGRRRVGNEAADVLRTLAARNRDLEAAMKAVEWSDIAVMFGTFEAACPVCSALREHEQHQDTCIVGNALTPPQEGK